MRPICRNCDLPYVEEEDSPNPEDFRLFRCRGCGHRLGLERFPEPFRKEEWDLLDELLEAGWELLEPDWGPPGEEERERRARIFERVRDKLHLIRGDF